LRPVPYSPSIPFQAPRPPRFALLALALLAGPACAADRDDPFGTAALRPGAPSQFRKGPAVACASSDRVPDPLRLADAIDIALCNNPQTRPP